MPSYTSIIYPQHCSRSDTRAARVEYLYESNDIGMEVYGITAFSYEYPTNKASILPTSLDTNNTSTTSTKVLLVSSDVSTVYALLIDKSYENTETVHFHIDILALSHESIDVDVEVHGITAFVGALYQQREHSIIPTKANKATILPTFLGTPQHPTRKNRGTVGIKHRCGVQFSILVLYTHIVFRVNIVFPILRKYSKYAAEKGGLPKA